MGQVRRRPTSICSNGLSQVDLLPELERVKTQSTTEFFVVFGTFPFFVLN
jgi:hypothetical protein